MPRAPPPHVPGKRSFPRETGPGALSESFIRCILCHYAKIMSFQSEPAMPEELRTRVNENGRVVIPSAFRKALGIEIGDEVVLRVEDDELRITTQQRRIQRAQRRARQYVKRGTSLVDELLAERREAAKRE